MITFRYVFIFSSVSVKFGESESSFLHSDKSLVEGMLISFHTEKIAPSALQNETTIHGLNIYFGPVTTFKRFKID